MPQSEAQCVCGYVSTTKNIHRHIRTCTVRPFALRVQDLERMLTAKTAEIDRLTKEIEELRNRPTTIYNDHSVNVNILAYGQEPLPTTQDVRNILLPPENSVARYIALKHFRDPCTSNLRISNKKSKTIQVVEPDINNHLRWTEKNRKEMIEKMVDDNLEELTDTHGARTLARWKRWYVSSGFEEPDYDKTEAYKRLQEDVENMLLSQRNTPLSDQNASNVGATS